MRKFLALLLLATLPLQGLAAAWMPPCQTSPAHGHPAAPEAAQAAVLAGAPCHHDSAPASGDPSGDRCAQCLLCTALIVPAAFGLHPAAAPGFYPSFAVTPRLGFVPEQPQRPPLA